MNDKEKENEKEKEKRKRREREEKETVAVWFDKESSYDRLNVAQRLSLNC